MKKKVLSVILSAFILIQLSVVYAVGEEAVYVSTVGADTGEGTVVSPVKTLERARELARERNIDTICVMAGRYMQPSSFTLDFKDSGLTIKSYGDGEVVFSGAKSLPMSRFKKTDSAKVLEKIPETARGNVYELNLFPYIGAAQEYSAVDSPIDENYGYYELYADGERKTLARWPNYSEYMSLEGINYLSINANTDRYKRWLNAENMIAYGYFCDGDYHRSQIKVEEIDENGNLIFERAALWGIPPASEYHVFNLIEELDTAGEWYIETTGEYPVLYYYPEDSDAELELSVNTDGIIKCTDGASDIVIDGITFENTRGDALRIENASDITVKNCVIRQSAHNGIYISNSENCVVEYCDIYDIGGMAVYAGGGNIFTLEPGNNVVRYCDIYDCGRVYCSLTYSACGIFLTDMGNRAENNTIHDLPGVAVRYNKIGHTISENEIYNVIYEMDDAGAVYNSGSLSNWGTLIKNNYIHDINNGKAGNAIYVDDCYHGVTIKGNVIENAMRAVMCGGGRNNTIDGNVIINNHITYDVRGTKDGWLNGRWCVDGTYDTELAELRANSDFNEELWCDAYPGFAEIIKDLENQRKDPQRYDAGIPKRVAVTNNIFVNGKAEGITPPYNLKKEYIIQNGNVDASNNFGAPAEDIEFADFENKNYAISDNSIIYKRLRGFEPIPFEEIGCGRETVYEEGGLEIFNPAAGRTVSVPFDIGWRETDGNYTLVIAKDAAMSSVELSEQLTVPYKEITDLQAGTYYIQVSDTTQKSSVISFSVAEAEAIIYPEEEPYVVSVSPENGAENVGIYTNVEFEISASEDIQALTVTEGGAEISDYSLSQADDGRYTVSFNRALNRNTPYTVVADGMHICTFTTEGMNSVNGVLKKDFENDETINVTLSGTNDSAVIETDPVSASRALKLTKGNEGNYFEVKFTLDEELKSEKIFVSYDLRIENLTDDAIANGYKILNEFAGLYGGNNALLTKCNTYPPSFYALGAKSRLRLYRPYGGGQENMADKYYSVKIVLDMNKDTYDIYFDNTLFETGIPQHTSTAEGLKTVKFFMSANSGASGEAAVAWIDNLIAGEYPSMEIYRTAPANGQNNVGIDTEIKLNFIQPV